MIEKSNIPKKIRKYFKLKEKKIVTVKGYISHLCDMFDEGKRVLSPYGSLWVNIGDKYSDGHQLFVPGRFAVEMQKRGWIMKHDITWHKPSCLSNSTRVYAKTQKGVMPTTIKDLVRLNPKTVKLWDGKKWNQVEYFIENNNPDNKLLIELRNGQNINCTKDHVFPTQRGNIMSKEFKIGDIIKNCNLPDTNKIEPKYIPDKIGWFIGLFIAEGNIDLNTVKIHGHKKETNNRLKELKPIFKEFGASYTVQSPKNTNAEIISVHGKIIISILNTFINGKIAKNKGLTTQSWNRNNKFLSNLLEGYLSGDGYYDKKNNRWRFNFTRNNKWASDLRVICSRLGYSIRLLKTFSKIGEKKYPSYQADLKINRGKHINKKEDGEVIKIKKGIKSKFWDIVLKDKPNLFSLDSGILVHNCMPSSGKKKFCNDKEYLFHFVKDVKKYHFQMIYEPFAPSTLIRCKAAYKSEKSKEQSSYIKSEAQIAWSKKALSGELKGRHKRTTWIYSPEFLKLKDDLTKEEKEMVFNKLLELEII